jgi:serine/threonine-protein kinase
MANSAYCPECKRTVAVTRDEGGGDLLCPRCLSAIGGAKAGADATVGQTISRSPAFAPAAPTPAAAWATASSVQGLMIDGRYEITGELGRGAFGVVYRASDQKLPRTVAVKMLNRELLGDAEVVRRFQEEARILCQVNHPHVLPVFDQGVHEDQHYIVFAFIEGKTVKELIPPGGLADPVRAARLAAKLAAALHYVYARHKILHRDVKPANMMLADGDENALYLMDFGLAVCHLADVTRATQDGTVMGTGAYMSPEQGRGEIDRIGHPSDLYSVAVVLFQLLTGRIPFSTSLRGVMGVMDIINQHISAPPPPPSALRRGLDPRLDAVVLKGLAKNAADRYQTGKEFADALEEWASTARVPAPVGGRDRPGRPSPVARELAGTTVEPLDLPDDEPPNSGHPSVVAHTTLQNQPSRPTRPGHPPAPPKVPAPGQSHAHRPVITPEDEPGPAPGGRGLVLTVVLSLVALGVLAAGIAFLVWAVRSGTPAPTRPTPPSGLKDIRLSAAPPAPAGDRSPVAAG